MSEAVIEIRDISLNLQNKQILSNINLTVNDQETVVLLGKNASGKTMFLKTIAGLFAPQAGSASFFGQNIYDLQPVALQDLRRKIGYVFQKSGLFDSLTVADNVVFALRRVSNKSNEELFEIARDLLHRSGLKDSEAKLPSELSGGMQKRAALARAIAMNPPVLLLDDPTAGLDPVLTDSIADLIIELKNSLNCASIVITHDLKFAYKLADRIGLLVSGELKRLTSNEDFQNSDDEYIKQFREGSLKGPIPVIE